jgi:ribose 1,5-bisphosphokinase
MSGQLDLPGTLVLVVGGSGVGKDAVIRGARVALGDDPHFAFPQRYITRQADLTEGHLAVTAEQFDDLDARQAFAVQWRAHGLSYALPISINTDLGLGRTVVCNASRATVAVLRQTYARLVVVEIHASLPVRASRLAGRNRETASDVAVRLMRDVLIPEQADHVVDNDNNLSDAIAAFLHLLLAEQT